MQEIRPPFQPKLILLAVACCIYLLLVLIVLTNGEFVFDDGVSHIIVHRPSVDRELLPIYPSIGILIVLAHQSPGGMGRWFSTLAIAASLLVLFWHYRRLDTYISYHAPLEFWMEQSWSVRFCLDRTSLPVWILLTLLLCLAIEGLINRNRFVWEFSLLDLACLCLALCILGAVLKALWVPTA